MHLKEKKYIYRINFEFGTIYLNLHMRISYQNGVEVSEL